MSRKVAKIFDFIPTPPEKLEFERVKKRKKKTAAKKGQMNLFAQSAQVLHLPSNLSPFEEALLLDERNDDRAEEAYIRAIEEGDDVADAYCNLGIIKSKAGNRTAAFDCFTKSLRHDPRLFESHYNLGNLYLEEGDWRLARMHYEMAAEVEPDHASAYFNLGVVSAIVADFPSALNALTKYKSLVSREEGRKADDLLETLKLSMGAKP